MYFLNNIRVDYYDKYYSYLHISENINRGPL